MEWVVEQYLAKLREGRAPDVDSLCREYPHLADELKQLIPSLEWIERCRPQPPGPRSEPAVLRDLSGATIGDYRIGREIGRGAMGIVFEAQQLSLGRPVALKILNRRPEMSPSARTRFRREAQVAAQLHHTNIVPVYGAGEDGDLLFYAMQLIQGQGLLEWSASQHSGPVPPTTVQARELPTREVPSETYLRSGDSGGVQSPVGAPRRAAAHPPAAPDAGRRNGLPRLDPREVARIGLEAAEALAYAHAQGVLHRDVKPGNLLIDLQQRVWVTDFGLAQLIDGVNLTHDGDIVGTLRYMAPERFRRVCDARADVYGLGLTLYELLSGEPAILGRQPAETIHEILTGRAIRLDRHLRLPSDLRVIVHKAVQYELDDRYQTAGELAADLRRFLDNQPVHARRQSAMRSAMLWARRNPLAATLSAATLFSLVIGSIVAATLAINWRSASIREQAAAAAAENSALLATAEAERSKNSLNLAQQALGELTSDVIRDYLASRQNLTGDQQSFLRKVLQYNQQLVSLAQSDRQSRTQQAHAQRSIASICYLLGELQQADDHARQAIDSFRRLAVDYPQFPEYGAEMGGVLIDLGRSKIDNQRWEEAVRCFTDARDALQQVKFDEATRSRTLALMATAENNLANIQLIKEAYAEAIDGYRQAIEIQTKLLAENPDDLASQSDLARSWNNLAITLQRDGRLDESRLAAAKALDMRETAALGHPGQPDLQLDHEGGLVVLGRIEAELGNHQEAIRCFLAACKIGEQLSTDFPSVPKYSSRWSTSLENLAKQYEQLEQTKEAEAVYRKMLELRAHLVAQFPEQISYRGWLAEANRALSLLLQSSQPQEALEFSQRAAAEFQQVIDRDASLQWAHAEWAGCLLEQGEILRRQLDAPRQAEPLIHQSMEKLQWLMDTHGTGEYRYFLGAAQGNIGFIRARLGHPQEAIDWFDRAEQVLLQIPQEDAFFDRGAENLHQVYIGRATEHQAVQQYPLALHDWRSAIQWAQSEMARTTGQVNLALTLARAGEAAAATELAEQLELRTDLTATQAIHVARICVLLAAVGDDESQRQMLLERAAKLLQRAHELDAQAVLALASDDEFQPVWSSISPVR